MSKLTAYHYLRKSPHQETQYQGPSLPSYAPKFESEHTCTRYFFRGRIVRKGIPCTCCSGNISIRTLLSGPLMAGWC